MTSHDATDPADVDPEMAELAGRLFDMARVGDTDTLVSYLQAGVPVNLTNQGGDTLLMLAAYHGHIDAVTALIGLGADTNRPNDKGQTPLAGAVFKSHDDVVHALVSAGADPDGGTPTARDAAVMFGREDYSTLWGLNPDSTRIPPVDLPEL